MLVDAIRATTEFYVVNALHTLVSSKYLFGMKSHERLLKDITAYKTILADKISQMLWDYSALVVFGEMRHAYSKAAYKSVCVPCGGSRNSSYEEAKQYSPEQIFALGCKVFDCEWDGGYGGKAWLKIAQCVSKRDIMPAEVFCDMCFSLSHNNSIYLDKYQSNIFRIEDGCEYKKVLDYKFGCIKIENVIITYRNNVSTILRKLIFRASNLGFLHCSAFFSAYDYIDKQIDCVLNYEPIEWENNELSMELEEGEYGHSEDEEDEEQQEDDDEEEQEQEEDDENEEEDEQDYGDDEEEDNDEDDDDDEEHEIITNTSNLDEVGELWGSITNIEEKERGAA